MASQLTTFLNAFALVYLTVFATLNLWFAILSYRRIKRLLRSEHLRPARGDRDRPFLPRVTLLVPAYNEEVTIAESVRSLLRLSYPSFEIVICNDGSRDRTLEVLRREFHLVRTDVEYHDHLATAPIRGFYESRAPRPEGLERLLVIDKQNGGKADALNAAINAARGDYVVSMDADSVLSPDALLAATRPIIEDPGVAAVGVQVGLSNGSVVEEGRVVDIRLPRSLIARFQIVEYMRSFAKGRMAHAELGSLLVLSGVFALLKRDLVVAIGGFLTRHMRARIGLEYCGPNAHTVCEDMEIVVRLHRYLLEKAIPGKVTLLPFPIAWTEAPESYRDLGKQRARWYRGLWEVLSFHRAMLFRPRFRQVGMFSLPYQVAFELLAPLLELLGYLGLIGYVASRTAALLDTVVLVGYAAAIHLCLSSLSVLLCVFSEQGSRARVDRVALFPYNRLSDVAILIGTGFLSFFGYRQWLLLWQLRGLWDFLRGKQGWDKFARRGFATRT
ncbi:MAG: glycosyltransferase family 2 protein [Deltaproteobacteria bacterium]|nr:glycosyltransferase family 2 protein [Deltaproteobacteria bacterium]